MTGMRFEILGPLRAWRDERELDLGPGKQRAVLAVLLLHAGRPVGTGQIVDAVWPEDLPANGPNVVQKYIAGLRRVLEPDRSPRAPGQLLSLTDAGYLLRVAPETVDAVLFEQRIRRARAARAREQLGPAAADLRAALELWRAEPLTGLPGSFFEAARVRLTESRAAAVELVAEVELLLGHHQELIGELARMVAEFPVRERLRYLLMLALYRSGRQADALAAFREIRALLAEDYGLEPGEELQELHRRILRSDPTLAPVLPVPAGPFPARDDGQMADVEPAAPPPVDVAVPPAPPVQPAAPAPPAVPVPAVAPMPPPSVQAAVSGSPGPPVQLPAQALPVAAPWGAPAASGGPRPERPRWATNLGTVLGAFLILVSFGFLTWVVMLYYAIRRRSVWLAAATAGYLGLVVLFVYAMERNPDPDVVTDLDSAGVFGLLVAWLAGLFHVVVLNRYVRALFSGRPADSVSPTPAAQRVRREQARYLLYHYPAARTELRIGRPDLPRGYDDGGLIDINAVPDQVIHQLAGLSQEQRRQVAVVRWLRGGFLSMEDLAAQCLLPPALTDSLREILVFLPRQPDPPAPVAGPPPTAEPAAPASGPPPMPASGPPAAPASGPPPGPAAAPVHTAEPPRVPPYPAQ
jgi:DNA-binding SARP family transcriptional activator